MTLLCPCIPLAKGIVAEIDASLQEGTFAHLNYELVGILIQMIFDDFSPAET
jgi:hypothetical protein